MTLSKKIQKALNDQLNAEFYSAYMYLSIAAYFEVQNLEGFGSWMRIQAREEVGHAMRFYEYLNDRGGEIQLAAIDAPPSGWKSPLAAIEAAFDGERQITQRIDDLADLSTREKDHATSQFLAWFVNEQVEEEQLLGSVVHKLKMVSDSPSGLYILDRELAGRTAEGV